MTIEEIKLNKADLESSIFNLINNFQLLNGFQVESVDISNNIIMADFYNGKIERCFKLLDVNIILKM